MRVLGRIGWLCLLPALTAAPSAADQESVVSMLSQNRISITANFDGSEVFVFGAVKREAPAPEDSEMEVIITLTGPLEPVLVRRKKKILGVWVNADTVEVDAAPSFYAVAANKPLNQIVSNVEDIFKDISVNQLIRSVGAPQHITDSPEFTKALIRIRESKGLYSTEPIPITVSDDTLFGAHFAMPANLVEGEYLARIFLVRNKTVVSEHSNKIDVRKVGLERWIYSEAHNHAFTYGLLCVLIAGLTGWAASVIFRRVG